MQRKEPFYSVVNNNAAVVILERRWGIYGFAPIYDALSLKYRGRAGCGGGVGPVGNLSSSADALSRAGYNTASGYDIITKWADGFSKIFRKILRNPCVSKMPPFLLANRGWGLPEFWAKLMASGSAEVIPKMRILRRDYGWACGIIRRR